MKSIRYFLKQVNSMNLFYNEHLRFYIYNFLQVITRSYNEYTSLSILLILH